jgi:hypothetical protein
MGCVTFQSPCIFFQLKSSLYVNYTVRYRDMKVCVTKIEDNLMVRGQKKLDTVLTAVQS